jgi:hypothetical protein
LKTPTKVQVGSVCSGALFSIAKPGLDIGKEDCSRPRILIRVSFSDNTPKLPMCTIDYLIISIPRPIDDYLGDPAIFTAGHHRDLVEVCARFLALIAGHCF